MRGEQVIVVTKTNSGIRPILVLVVNGPQRQLGTVLWRQGYEDATAQVFFDKMIPDHQCDLRWTCVISQQDFSWRWGRGRRL